MTVSTITTFEVSSVERATIPMPEVSAREVILGLLAGHDPRLDRFLARLGKTHEDFGIPQRRHVPSFEACSRLGGSLVADIAYHPMVAALERAFVDHRPVSLSPDMIWLMITQGVANHINANAEQLRRRLVRHDSKLQIVVRRDDFVKGSPENLWPEVFADFSRQIRQHIGPHTRPVPTDVLDHRARRAGCVRSRLARRRSVLLHL